MSDQQDSQIPQNITVQLEVVPEDERESDIADIDEVGRSVFEQLTNNGFTVTYRKKRGRASI